MGKNETKTLNGIFADIRAGTQRAPTEPAPAMRQWRDIPPDMRIALVRWRIEQMVNLMFDKWPADAQTMFKTFADYLRQSKKRWLLLIGGVGVGKTTLVKAMAWVYNTATSSQADKMRILNAATLAEYYRADNADEIINIRKKVKILVDDIGTEPESLNVYGNTVYPFVDLITHKYDDPAAVLLMTTNLTSDEIASRYGERVLDRIVEKCFIIINNSKSLRQ